LLEFLSGKRIPLSENQFTDANAAQFYDEHAQRFMESIYRRFAARAARISDSGNKVLDVGTGSGLLAIELARVRSDWQITGIDISENMLKLARQKANRVGFTEGLNFQQASAEALPFPENYFNLVVSQASLHLWINPVKVFNEIARVTVPGGYCIIWDNLRLSSLGPLLNMIGGAMRMSVTQRRLWMQAVRSSYTVGETEAIVGKSALKDARVNFIPGFLGLGIEWIKPAG
jgi:SAM-dependent methyltransferase